MADSLISADRLAEFLLVPPSISAASNPFPVMVVETPLDAAGSFADHALGLYTSGRRRITREMDGRSVEGWSDPGTLNYTPPNRSGTWHATGSSRAIVLLMPDAFLTRVLAEHWEAEPRQVEMIPQFLERDAVLEGMLTRLAHEVRNDSPFGRLYAESACEFLAHHLIYTYSSLSKPALTSRGGLPRKRLKAVVDYIYDTLGQPIALRQLAALAGVSVRHFERAFRQSLGVPPHAFVLRARVNAARDLLLLKPELSVQAGHLATVFRRHTGHSPRTFRRLNSQ
jgi:AraC family transcriptional regulator